MIFILSFFANVKKHNSNSNFPILQRSVPVSIFAKISSNSKNLMENYPFNLTPNQYLLVQLAKTFYLPPFIHISQLIHPITQLSHRVGFYFSLRYNQGKKIFQYTNFECHKNSISKFPLLVGLSRFLTRNLPNKKP